MCIRDRCGVGGDDPDRRGEGGFERADLLGSASAGLRQALRVDRADFGKLAGEAEREGIQAVSYTNLTPPTSDPVWISVVAGSIKKKKKKTT